MKITITMDLTQENLSKLNTLLSLESVNLPVEEFDAPSEKPVEQETEPVNTEPVVEDEAPAAVTKTDIRAVALKLSKAGKQKELANAFAKFGCKKLSDFDSRTEDYPALMRELVSING